MSAAGFVGVPVLPTFKGLSKEFAEHLIKPAEKAGEQAGKAMSAPLDGAVANLEKQVKASSGKLTDLDRAHEKSISKREQQQDKLEASTLRLEDAENKYKAAIEAGDSGLRELARVKDEKAKVKKATDDLRQAEIDVTVAERKHKDQLDDLTRTTEKYEDAQEELNNSVKGSGGIFDKFREDVRKAGAELDDTAEKSAGFGDKIISGLGKIGTGALLGVGAKIGTTVMGGIDTAFSSGFGRLASIEQAETMLGGLGHSAGGVAEIMDNAMDSVSGTAYGFGEAASMAATFAGAGIEQGEELTEVLSLVGDSAAITGAGFEEMGSIWTKMASSGRLSTDEMNQLMDRGLGLLPELQKHYNVTADEARKMVSDGEVSFQDFSEIMENMVGGSAQAMGDTFSGSAANMQAALGRLGAKFLDPIYENAPAIFQAIGGAVDKLGEHLGPLIEDFSERLSPYIEDFAERLGPWLEQSIDDLAGKIEDLVGWGREAISWMQDNQTWLGPLAAAIGGAAAAWGAWTLAVKGWQAATEIATGVQAVFNAVMAANPIMLVVIAVAALVAGLVYFFTRTEKGKELWEKFTTALSDGWDWVVGKLSAGWEWLRDNVFEPLWTFVSETVWPALQTAFEFISDAWTALGDGVAWAYDNLIKPTFDFFVTAGKLLFAVLTTVVFTPIKIAWNLLSEAFQWAWEQRIKPVWDAISSFATETLWPILQDVFGWIGEKWQQLSDLFGTVWGWLRDNVFAPLAAFVTETLWPALESAFTWIGDKWQWLSDTLGTVWGWIREHVIDRAIRGFQNIWEAVLNVADWVSGKWAWLKDMLIAGWNLIYDWVISPYVRAFEWLWEKALQVVDWIVDKWNWMRDKLGEAWAWIDEKVFGPIGRGLETVKGWFETGVDAIGRIWDGLKAKLAEPINFVIRTVYTDGIKEVFDGVAEKVGLDSRLPAIKEIGGFYRGGILPGWSRMQDGDDQLVPMRRGEGVLVSEGLRDRRSREAFLAANEAAKSGLPFADFVERARGYAIGGIINYAGGGMSAVQASHARFVGKYFENMFALTSTNRNEPGSYHDFGVQGATDWQAQDGHFQTQMPTPWSKALANAIYVNFPNSRELIHYPLDGWQNILDGSPHVYNAGTNAGHGNHVHWATGSPIRWEDGELVLDDLPGSAGAWFNPANWFSGLWDRITGALPKFDGSGFGDLAEWPGATLKTLGGWVKDWALDKLASLRNLFTGGDGGGGAQQWSAAASEALKRAGYDDSLLDITLQQVDIESSGSPTARNDWDSNAMIGDPTVGLLQVRGATFQMMRNMYPEAFADLPNDRTDPVANMTAGILWSKYAYGGPQNVWPTRDGYADGGIVDFSNLLVRDFGGLVPHGAVAINMSGRDEMMLPPETTALMNQFFAEFPEVAQALVDATQGLENAAHWLEQAASPHTEEGVTARQSARRFLDLGLDIPGAEIITAVLDGEEALWESRARGIGHLDNLAEKEAALEDARRALAELAGQEISVSEDEQKKLEDAKAAVEEAKAGQAKADSDEARAEAADKLADAEANLTSVREDLEASTAQSAEQHATDLTQANEDVAAAEQDLIAARQAQVKDLDNIVLVSQSSITGLIPQAEALASQIIGMGAPVHLVAQGLGAVTGGLASIAGLVGPAGITLGMVFDAAKIIISLIKTIVNFVRDLINRIREAHLAAVQAMADGWQVIADYAALVVELQGNVSSLQQEIVRGLNEQRVAEFQLRVAQQDRLVAEAESALAVAEARLALDREIERGNIAAQLRLMGLHEDWDSYLSYQALVAGGVLDEWSDAAISALFTYEATRAQALRAELSARVDQINAEAQLAAITRQNTRNQQDLLKAQERLIRMSADVAGVDLVDATATSQVAKIIAEMAEIQQKMDSSLLGRLGVGAWGDEHRGRQAELDSYRQVLHSIAEETGVAVSDAQINQAISQMKRVSWTDGDPMAVLRGIMPGLVEAETALRMQEYMGPIWDAQDQRDQIERDIEDFESEIDLFDRTQPLEETLAGLDYTIASLEQAAQAWADGNEGLRGDYLAAARAQWEAARALGVDWQLDDGYATPGVRDQITKEVTIHMDGSQVYTADQVDALLAEVTSGSNVRVTTKKSSTTVANARREGGV